MSVSGAAQRADAAEPVKAFHVPGKHFGCGLGALGETLEVLQCTLWLAQAKQKSTHCLLHFWGA
jgi:hypothetical protein